MGTKKTKSFSPYTYGITYRKIGESPFRKYQYVPTGQGEPVYTLSKKVPSYFCSITNFWYFNVDDFGVITFLKVDSSISINNEKRLPYLRITNMNEIIKSTSFDINLSNGVFYFWKDDNILKLSHHYNVEVDTIILINDEYVDNKCKKYFYSGFLEVDFNNIMLKSTDKIKIIVYPISSNNYVINSQFYVKVFDINDVIDDQLNNCYLIKNQTGMIDKRYIIKKKNHEILNQFYFNVFPSYISINKNEIHSLDEIDSILAYSSLTSIKTFIIQYGINNHSISWDGNIVKITHNFNGLVNFIIDTNDNRFFTASIVKVDDNNLNIIFNENQYVPNVFTIVIFKIGE